MVDSLNLQLPEEVFLLAIDPSVGELPPDKQFKPVLAAAILLEMACQNRIVSEGRAGFLMRNSQHGGNVFMDTCLDQIRGNLGNTYLKNWVTDEETGFQNVIPGLLGQCENLGLIKVVTKRVAFIFSKDVLEDTQPDLRSALVSRVMAAVNTPRVQVDARTYCLVKVLQSSPHLFNHVIATANWASLNEPIEELGSIDADLVQRIYGTLLHCCCP